MTTVPAKQISVVNNIRVPENIKASAFGLQYRGYISIQETGIYSYLTSDDGSILRIGNKTGWIMTGCTVHRNAADRSPCRKVCIRSP
jgi:hypothetical protein